MNVIAAALALGLPAAASAAPLVYDLTSDHCTGGCGTPPFGSVTLTQTGTTVDVDVDLFGTNTFVKSGAGDFQNFKFNATGVALADITVDQNLPGQTLVANTGAFNGDGTGNFGFGIVCSACKNGSAGSFGSDIIFHVANATIADLTAPNGSGITFVADILGSTGNTGPVDATTANPVNAPEPGTLALLAGALAGFGVVRRRNRR